MAKKTFLRRILDSMIASRSREAQRYFDEYRKYHRDTDRQG